MFAFQGACALPRTYLVAYDTTRCAREDTEECFAHARGLGQRDRQI
jgi:hypothetical protein